MKIIDLVGQRFGRLVVDRRVTNGKYGVQWLCHCDCGNDIIVPTVRLRSGKTSSCGCYQREKLSERRSANLTGKTFTNLYVNKRIGTTEWHSVIWECQCSCGKIINVTTSDLISGHTKSCGCYKGMLIAERSKIDLIGRRFGKLVVHESVDGRKHDCQLWKCLCDCGNVCLCDTRSLTSGRVKSCGCMKSSGEKMISDWLNRNNVMFIREKTWSSCKSVRKLPFDFWLPDYGLCIEFDGEQHFRETRFKNSNDTLANRKERDDIKTNWCYENDIILLRISYKNIDNIESILSEWLFLNDAEDANSSDVDLSA